MAMDPGKLRHRVTLQARGAGSDALGQASGAWQTLATVWAQVTPLRGREYFAAAAVQQEDSIKVTIRHRADLTAGHRLLWRGQPYDITSAVDVAGQREWTEILAITGGRDGR